jgi:hypothetical protein
MEKNPPNHVSLYVKSGGYMDIGGIYHQPGFMLVRGDGLVVQTNKSCVLHIPAAWNLSNIPIPCIHWKGFSRAFALFLSTKVKKEKALSPQAEERYCLDWRMTREGQNAYKVTGNIPFATRVRTGYKRSTQKKGIMGSAAAQMLPITLSSMLKTSNS